MKAQRLPEPALRTASWDAKPGDRSGAELATTGRVLMKPRCHPAQWLAEALPNAHVQQRPPSRSREDPGVCHLPASARGREKQPRQRHAGIPGLASP